MMLGDKPHILVVDDDDRLRALLKRYLTDNGFLISTAVDTKDAESKLALFSFDMMVLDIMMPGETGLEFARRLRGVEEIPILLLTAMGDAEDRITGLEAGAEDYLSKPFEPRELVLRIKRIIDRRMESRKKSEIISFGLFEFDLNAGRLTRQKEPVYLTPAEIQLLKSMIKQVGIPLSREELCKQIGMPGNERTIDVQINRLRKKIEDTPSKPIYIQTVRSAGYAFFVD